MGKMINLTCETCGRRQRRGRPASGHRLCIDCSVAWYEWLAIAQGQWLLDAYKTWSDIRRFQVEDTRALSQ